MSIFLKTSVLVIGAGGAGMYAAIAANRSGASVLLVDKSIIGRSGATIMAQMTAAAALGEEEPDDWRYHFRDTVEAGRGLVNEPLAKVLCSCAPARFREMDAWKIGWSRSGKKINQVHAPGHDRKRCAYVDFLNTGPAVARTLRSKISKMSEIVRTSDLAIVDVTVERGRVTGAIGFHLESGMPVVILAKAVIIATGGLTKLFSRNSASTNMCGDGYALALRAGARLVDMEFVQFFPIGHLAPRMIGMDPIMWDPFRYKLGGRLVNSLDEEFTENYGIDEKGSYVITRDVATYAIFKEVEAGRGSPNGGAWLSFKHLNDKQLREAFGPVIDRLAKNGIDLTREAIEVAPIAHYHMGGVRVDETLSTDIEGLFAAGEVVGGANGANRLSGNAITEALVFGELAGNNAGEFALNSVSKTKKSKVLVPEWLAKRLQSEGNHKLSSPTTIIRELQKIMQRNVGPFRTEGGLREALDWIDDKKVMLRDFPIGSEKTFNLSLIDWFDLRNMLLVAECIATAALKREESRGAHQREDFPTMDDTWMVNQLLLLKNGNLELSLASVPKIINF